MGLRLGAGRTPRARGWFWATAGPLCGGSYQQKKPFTPDTKGPPVSGPRASAPLVPCILNVRHFVLCVLNRLNIRAFKDCTSCAGCLPTPLFLSSLLGALVTARFLPNTHIQSLLTRGSLAYCCQIMGDPWPRFIRRSPIMLATPY